MRSLLTIVLLSGSAWASPVAPLKAALEAATDAREVLERERKAFLDAEAEAARAQERLEEAEDRLGGLDADLKAALAEVERLKAAREAARAAVIAARESRGMAEKTEAEQGMSLDEATQAVEAAEATIRRIVAALEKTAGR